MHTPNSRTFLSVILGLMGSAPVMAADAAPAPAPWSHEGQASASGLFTAGNVFSLSGKGGGFYQVKYQSHVLRMELAGAVIGAALDTDKDPATGFEVPLHKNINTQLSGRLRYDYFLTENDALYAALAPSHDTLVNLMMRNRAEAGYKRVLFKSESQSLSVEGGLVYTMDYAPLDGDTNEDGKVDVKDAKRFEKNWGTVGARALMAYSLTVADNLSVTQTVELLPNLFPEVEAPYRKLRYSDRQENRMGVLEATVLSSNTSLNVSLTRKLTTSMIITFVYDNGAIARRNAQSNADLAASWTLTFKFL